ncbi:hypothetical protein TUZN_1737 [Thermoproteus uzoniensis 768-20]|uniref:Uncharacterized protein n=2 Tax=Thermoproteus TaxID=2270 RepID=F2L3G0_THEU7|nr:hypothetical protein TUZN_1737 [Thermoproteus uzoniensis 768-20]
MRLVSFKISERVVRGVDMLVTKGIFVTRNEAIRAALDMYFEGTAKRWLEMYNRRKAKS